MKDIIIILLVIFLLITIFYLFLLKKGIKKFNKDLNQKLKDKSNTILTTNFSDRDLCHLIDSINNSLKSYNDIRIDYEKKNNNLQKMMTNISHDLRIPLTSALGYIDMTLKSDLDEKTKIKNLKIIEERLKRLSELVDSFFEFSKIISNNKFIEIRKINLVALLESSISNHYEDFSNDNRIINFETDNRKVYINSNKIMLSRIFDNLIRNAYKHSKSDLNIELKSKNKIEIIFSNDLLYSDLDIERMFEEFYTIDISRTKGNTGLGLAIVKEFTNQLNGKIYAKKKNHKLYIIISFN